MIAKLRSFSGVSRRAQWRLAQRSNAAHQKFRDRRLHGTRRYANPLRCAAIGPVRIRRWVGITPTRSAPDSITTCCASSTRCCWSALNRIRRFAKHNPMTFAGGERFTFRAAGVGRQDQVQRVDRSRRGTAAQLSWTRRERRSSPMPLRRSGRAPEPCGGSCLIWAWARNPKLSGATGSLESRSPP